MIVSHRHRYIFVDTLCAGADIVERLLVHHTGPEDIVAPCSERREPSRNHRGWFLAAGDLLDGAVGWRDALRFMARWERFHPGMGAASICRRVSPEIWSDYFVFAVERNPWAKVAEHFQRHCHRPPYRDLTVNEYLEAMELPVNYPRYMCPETGELRVDRVLTFEHLPHELGEVMRALGMPEADLAPACLSAGRQQHMYRELLDEQQAAKIAELCAPEVALHDYSF